MDHTIDANGHASHATADRAPRDIPVRRPAFDFEGIEARHWFMDDAYATHLMHAMSVTFPEGERFFMDAVRHYKDRVKSPALRHEISRFLAQEAMHGKAHAAFNAWIRARGNDTEAMERQVREELTEARETVPARERLAVTCALEHFTAILAERLLEDEELREAMPPELRRLWVWHAVEETEHKAVAFDTFVETGGTYRTRAIAMLITTVSFLYRISKYQTELVRKDPEAHGAFSILRGWAKMWIWPGKLLPVIPAYLDYYRPGFHPWDRAPHPSFEALRREMDAFLAQGVA